MKILVVQESDWLKRNPHQQHHLMDRLSIKGHEILVIDYPIDWNNKKLDEKERAEINGPNPGSLFYGKKIYANVHKINKDANIDVIRPNFIKLPVLNYISLAYYHRKEINKQIKEFKPDVIVSLGLMNAMIASNAAKKHNIPHVYYLIDVLYSLIPEKALQSFGKKVNEKAINNSDLVITINQKLKELAIKLGANPETTIIIDAGIDLDEFDPKLDDSDIRGMYQIDKDDQVLFFMGWIYTFSGMVELAKTLGEAKKLGNTEYSKLKLLIVGDGDDYQNLKEIQKEYDIKDQLILTGKQPYERIPEFLATADFCLLPAHKDEEIMQDIVPIKLYEYLAMKKVVIATDLPGVRKEFGEGNGIIYVNGAEEVPNTVINILKNNEYDEIAKFGRSYVENNDWKKITDNFEKVLNDLIN
ncbi:MAG: glycosyltransferase [Methanobacteriaceae archaeon]